MKFEVRQIILIDFCLLCLFFANNLGVQSFTLTAGSFARFHRRHGITNFLEQKERQKQRRGGGVQQQQRGSVGLSMAGKDSTDMVATVPNETFFLSTAEETDAPDSTELVESLTGGQETDTAGAEETPSAVGIAIAIGVAGFSLSFLVLQSLAFSCIVLATLLFVANKGFSSVEGGDGDDSPFRQLSDANNGIAATFDALEMSSLVPEAGMLQEAAVIAATDETVVKLQARIDQLEQEASQLKEGGLASSSGANASGEDVDSMKSRISELEEHNEELEQWITKRVLIEKADSEYTVAELRKMAKENELDTTGTKKLLLERLVEHDLI